MKRGELWVVALEPKRGAEVGKQRPALIVQTDLLNDVGHPTVIVAPISSQRQQENLLRFAINCPGLHRGAGYVLMDQLRAIDAQHRLKKRIGRLAASEMKAISELLANVLDL